MRVDSESKGGIHSPECSLCKDPCKFCGHYKFVHSDDDCYGNKCLATGCFCSRFEKVEVKILLCK
jgi:hypothetical protein